MFNPGLEIDSDAEDFARHQARYVGLRIEAYRWVVTVDLTDPDDDQVGDYVDLVHEWYDALDPRMPDAPEWLSPAERKQFDRDADEVLDDIARSDAERRLRPMYG